MLRGCWRHGRGLEVEKKQGWVLTLDVFSCGGRAMAKGRWARKGWKR